MADRPSDPWSDVPRWSHGHEAHVEPALAPPEAGHGSGDPRTCPWCATPAIEDATRCSHCDAALAQRESIGELVIPGLTAVDPALKDLDGRPLHLAGPSSSHGVASGAIVAAAAGGPLGLAILGGVGAVAAVEYLGASRGRPGEKGHDNIGETSDAVRQAVERQDRGEALPPASDRASDQASAPDGDAQSDLHDDGTQEASDGVR